MKKKILAALLACCMCFSLAAGGDKKEKVSGGTEFKDGKFVETAKITVEVYDRGNDGGSDPTNNMYTDFIKKGLSPNEAWEKAKGHYGQFEGAAKYIDPRKE